ncbi:MAG: amidohydrolase [Firmicutes bacterium]|nr:amidohydrolase [Bacillota bacterium]
MKTRVFLFGKVYPRAAAPAIINAKVAVADGIIQWLGPAEQYPVPGEYAGPVALPGFIDSHVHLTATGLDLLAIDARRFSSLSDFLAALHEADREGEGLVRAWGFDPDNFRERRYPTLAELDRACPRNPLWSNHIESHGTLVNSRSLALLGISAGQPLLTGNDNQRARNFFLAAIGAQERERAILAAAELAASRGVTTLHAMEGGKLFHNKDIEAVLALQDRLPVDTVIYPQVLDVEWAWARGFTRIGGCLPLDGSSGVYTAALTRPYYQRSDSGLLYFSRAEIFNYVRQANARGMQVAMHACGDAAIDLFLDAVEADKDRQHPAVRHRIEHFELPRRDQVDRCRRLNVILSMQPAFDWFWGGPDGDYAATLGPRGWQNANPLGWAVAAGLLVAGGSDSDVTPLDPLLGIHAAINHHNPDQRISLEQAVAMFTENGALAAGLGDRGRLEPGLRADMAVLDRDPWEKSRERLKDIAVTATIRAGCVVWRAEPTGRDGQAAPAREI